MHGEHRDRQQTDESVTDPFDDLMASGQADPGLIAVLRQSAQREADETGRTYEEIARRLARVVTASGTIRRAYERRIESA